MQLFSVTSSYIGSSSRLIRLTIFSDRTFSWQTCRCIKLLSCAHLMWRNTWSSPAELCVNLLVFWRRIIIFLLLCVSFYSFSSVQSLFSFYRSTSMLAVKNCIHYVVYCLLLLFMMMKIFSFHRKSNRMKNFFLQLSSRVRVFFSDRALHKM